MNRNTPIIFSDTPEDRKKLQEVMKSALVVGELDEQLKELQMVRHPELLKSGKKTELAPAESVWVYYPWRNTVVNCLNPTDYKVLRTSRNKYLLFEEEQNALDGMLIGIAGLNVGNPGAVCIALESEAGMKLADNDILSVSNLNRFRAGLPDLGINKALLSARQIYEINPFAKLEVFDNGISPENINDFLSKPRIDILIEETDNLFLKISLREEAKKKKIPVVMVTGNGENVIIDVERYDREKDLPLMNGLLEKKVIEDIKKGPKSFEDKINLARDFMGSKYLNGRLVDSFRLVGSELAGIPQIAESSFLRGASICYFVRKISLDLYSGSYGCRSGRYNLNISDVQKL